MNNFILADNLNDQEIIKTIILYYHQSLKSNSQIQEYISNQYHLSGDELEKFLIGYADGSMVNMIPENGDIKEKIKNLNFLSHEIDYFKNYITFPVIDQNNIIQDVIGFNPDIHKNKKPKIRYLKRNNPVLTLENPSVIKIIKALINIRTVHDNPNTEPLLKSSEHKGSDSFLENDLAFQYGPRTYRIRGLNTYSFSKLKVNVKVIQDKTDYLDTVDLYVARNKVGLINKISELFNESYDIIESEIRQLIEDLDKIRLKKKLEKEPIRQEIPVITVKEKNEIIKILETEDLMKMIKDDLTKIGITGEDKNKIMLYMVYTSRKLNKPLSVVVKGDSAGGKSYLALQVLKLFPPEDIKNFTEISEKSLFYMKEDELCHKILLIFERHGSRSSDYSIRSLQSEEQLQLAVTSKDPQTGEFATIQKTVNGPIAYVETTTELLIHPENQTRMFDLYVDESEEQTKRIYDIQNNLYLPEDSSKNDEIKIIIRKHQIIQRLLKTVKVMIPYVRYIEFPTHLLRLRRDRARFLALIETITFLHQYQRKKIEINGEKYIVSERDDYSMAYEIAEEIMQETLSTLNQKSRELLDILSNMDRMNFSISDIREKTGWYSVKIKRYLKPLVEEEYVEQILSGHGRKGIFRVSKRPGRAGIKINVLPTPEELKKKLEHLHK